MIKNLRWRFIFIAMISFLVVIAVIVGTMNIVNFIRSENEAEAMLALISENGGRFPEINFDPSFSKGDVPPEKGNDIHERGRIEMTPETQYKTRYFCVEKDGDGEVLSVDLMHIAAVSAEAAEEYAAEVLASGRDRGRIDIYKYAVSVIDGGVSRVVFLDYSDIISGRQMLLVTSLIVSAASLLAVFLLVAALSGRAVKPFAESVEKQKRFITDAGHEIKTPLAIISANTEVIEMTGGGNEWTASIKNQTERLGELVNRMILLAKADEKLSDPEFADFCLSDAVMDIAQSYETPAECAGKRFDIAVEPKVELRGDERAICRLVSILCDNALKYCDDGGEIGLVMRTFGGHIELTVSNSCRGFDISELPRLFDRFYRSDKSRSRESGGYGLGLSIARAIVEAHGGKIEARYEGEKIFFDVIL